MVRMEMRIDCFDEPKVEFVQELDITTDLLQHGIDDQCFAAAPAGKKVAVRARARIEHLPENHAKHPLSIEFLNRIAFTIVRL